VDLKAFTSDSPGRALIRLRDLIASRMSLPFCVEREVVAREVLIENLIFRISRGEMRQLGLLISLMLIVLVAPAKAQESGLKLVNKVQPSIVLIVTYDRRGRLLNQGSGFFVARDKVITSKHVIADAFHSRIVLANGQAFTVKGVVARDEGGDLVLLRVKVGNNQGASLIIKEDLPPKGERVYVVGHRGGGWSVSSGDLLAVYDFTGIGERLRITAQLMPGSSGSPVLNGDGQVIGVASSVFTSNEPLYFVIPAKRIIALLARSARTSE
jgi:S1-C subfamily serine protease